MSEGGREGEGGREKGRERGGGAFWLLHVNILGKWFQIAVVINNTPGSYVECRLSDEIWVSISGG